MGNMGRGLTVRLLVWPVFCTPVLYYSFDKQTNLHGPWPIVGDHDRLLCIRGDWRADRPNGPD